MDPLFGTLRKVLGNYPSVRLCTVFGSIASGKSTSGSDLDLGVAAEEPLTAEQLLELLEAFSAATGRTVDLIDLLTESGPILKQALCKGVLAHNSDRLLYARLISRMLFAEADMMPYYHRIPGNGENASSMDKEVVGAKIESLRRTTASLSTCGM